jgi:hypothetical protein
MPRPLYGNDPVPVVQEAGWAPGPVWTDAENLASIRITNKISSINVKGTLSNNGQIIVKEFNNYFISVTQNILLDNHNLNHNLNINSNNESSTNDNPLAYLLKAFNQPFPNIKLKYTSSKEIEDITNSLKMKYSHGYDGIATKVLK